ncbi:hypothetical protein BZG36_03153 [Bifiguratus adelaidae]|uniref:Uncharacterized protein n=1 Tax=Bifiguratus adelaidae TaxID=1938954 RepID=A0A261Y156_9FUNG|nr:hypothetical protein BZG36_03153 [Bifiguratus adelaidae]
MTDVFRAYHRIVAHVPFFDLTSLSTWTDTILPTSQHLYNTLAQLIHSSGFRDGTSTERDVMLVFGALLFSYMAFSLLMGVVRGMTRLIWSVFKLTMLVALAWWLLTSWIDPDGSLGQRTTGTGYGEEMRRVRPRGARVMRGHRDW